MQRMVELVGTGDQYLMRGLCVVCSPIVPQMFYNPDTGNTGGVQTVNIS